MRIVEIELSPTENRMLKVYRKKNNLDLQTFCDMSQEERNDLFNNIATNYRLYPVPVTEPEYFYHGTSKDRLASIKQNGLTTDNKSRWGKTTVGGAHSKDRIFFSPDLDVAEWYATRASHIQPMFLRVSSKNIPAHEVDSEEKNSIFVTSPIPPQHIEAWNGRRWVQL